MNITDEMIACYAEGVCTDDELKVIRQYMITHPDEYERIICLMDENLNYLQDSEYSNNNDFSRDSFANIALSAAAFVPQSTIIPSQNHKACGDYNGTIERLKGLCNEIYSI